MYFPSEHVTKTVFAFDRLPTSPEKEALAKRYCSDEISLFEFVALAEELLK
jgi:hypothetical protein